MTTAETISNIESDDFTPEDIGSILYRVGFEAPNIDELDKIGAMGAALVKEDDTYKTPGAEQKEINPQLAEVFIMVGDQERWKLKKQQRDEYDRIAQLQDDDTTGWYTKGVNDIVLKLKGALNDDARWNALGLDRQSNMIRNFAATHRDLNDAIRQREGIQTEAAIKEREALRATTDFADLLDVDLRPDPAPVLPPAPIYTPPPAPAPPPAPVPPFSGGGPGPSSYERTTRRFTPAELSGSDEDRRARVTAIHDAARGAIWLAEDHYYDAMDDGNPITMAHALGQEKSQYYERAVQELASGGFSRDDMLENGDVAVARGLQVELHRLQWPEYSDESTLRSVQVLEDDLWQAVEDRRAGRVRPVVHTPNPNPGPDSVTGTPDRPSDTDPDRDPGQPPSEARQRLLGSTVLARVFRSSRK